jgi:hypothetical protein
LKTQEFHLTVFKIYFTKGINFNPKFSEELSSNTITLETNNTSLLIDSRFQNNQILLSHDSSKISTNCSFSSSSIVCQKVYFPFNPLSDIYFEYFTVLSNTLDLTKIKNGILVFSKLKVFNSTRNQQFDFYFSIGIFEWKQC